MKNLKNGLSKRQSDILHFIKKRIKEDSIPPSIQDICNEFGFSSTNGVHQQLLALEKKGFIKRPKKGASRSIQLTDDTEWKEGRNGKDNGEAPLTIIGEGSAENPLSVFFTNQGNISVDRNYFDLEGQAFAVSVGDDSLSKEGIMAGDLAVALHNTSPKDGDTVVAIHNDMNIIRKYHEKADGFELRASSRGFPAMKFKNGENGIAIIGNIKGVIKKL